MTHPVAAFGPWLKERRKALDLTQRDLAARAGYSLETIVKIETGERRPSKQVAERLATCLSIPAEQRAAFVQFARATPGEAPPPPPDVASGAPAAPAPAARPGAPANLPAPPNAFIGRVPQVAAAGALLRRPGVRLLTLTGAPGIGKTRLSLAVAHALRGDFAHGIYFVPLAPIRDPPLVVSAIAGALDVRESARRPLLDSLTAFLANKTLLLVLDNFEQVLAAGPQIATLLAAAPALKILISSRSVLHLYGEHEFPVPPLELPDPAATPPAALGDYEGVALFVERAQAVLPGFVLTPDNAGPVAAICRRLDGLPLAIELAAACSKFLAPPALLARLAGPQSRLALLTGGPQDLPARQRTLRGTIAWSYDLLAPAEQALFRRLAVFAGGAAPEAIAAVTRDQGSGIRDQGSGHAPPGTNPPTPNPQPPTPILASLVAKSLLQQEEDRGAPRYSLLETIGEYAGEQLGAAGEEPVVRQAHAAYFLALAEEAAPALRGPDQAAWLDRLEREHDNLRAALRWALATGAGDQALRLAAALGGFWFRRGYLSEGRAWLVAALAPGGPVPLAARAHALYWAGRSAWRQGDHTAARAQYQQSLAGFQAGGDGRGRALVLIGLGMMAGDEGDFAAERALYAESLAAGRALDDPWSTAQALHILGLQAATQGDYAAARAYQEESLPILRALGDQRSIAHALSGLGSVLLAEHDPAAARALYAEVVAIFRELQDKAGTAGALVSLGEVARWQGDYAAAAALLEESLPLWQELGDNEGLAMPLHNLGHAVLRQGDAARAGALFVESLGLFERMGIKFGIAICLAGLAGVAAAHGQGARAARLFGAADALIGGIGGHLQAADLADYAHHLALAQTLLPPEEWTAAWAEGAGLSLAQALADAGCVV